MMKRLLEIIPEVLVFDCGDTLLELNIPRENIFQEVLAKEGVKVELDYIRRAYDIVDWSFKQRSSQERTAEAKKRFFDGFNVALCNVLGLSNYSGVINMQLQDAIRQRCRWIASDSTLNLMSWVSNRYECYVLANWSRNLPQVMSQAGILHFFKGVYSSDELGAEKPNPESYERFLEVTGMQGRPKLYIGNEYIADVVGSRAHGFEPVLLDWIGKYPPEVDCLKVSDWGQLRASLENQ
jgi:putative hydrolase of the HAD superfamily